MSERHRFRPATVEGLETRVVLNRSALIAPVISNHLKNSARISSTQAVVNQVNLTFDSFTSDYLQAQGVYLANSTAEAHIAFKQYVDQRVELLAAQLTRIFAHVPGSLNRSQTSTPGGPVIVQTFLKTRIDGVSRTSLLESLEGRSSGAGAIPPKGTTGTTATLYTDQAISAIETAQTSTINSVAFLYSHSFQ